MLRVCEKTLARANCSDCQFADGWHQREAEEFCWKREPSLWLNYTIGYHCMRCEMGSGKAAVMLKHNNKQHVHYSRHIKGEDRADTSGTKCIYGSKLFRSSCQWASDSFWSDMCDWFKQRFMAFTDFLTLKRTIQTCHTRHEQKHWYWDA